MESSIRLPERKPPKLTINHFVIIMIAVIAIQGTYLAPLHVNITDDHWIGAWWLGFLICGVLYLLCSIPFFFFPKSYRYPGSTAEQHPLNKPNLPSTQLDEHLSGWQKFKKSLIAEFPFVLFDLIRNPVFVTIVIAWMFGSYLIGGYQTYLPKYIETQFGRSASMADLYADRGNCVIYDNSKFRFEFHLTSAIMQALAVIFVLICYVVARKRTFPEEEDARDVVGGSIMVWDAFSAMGLVDLAFVLTKMNNVLAPLSKKIMPQSTPLEAPRSG
uniref:Transmembrane protein n=1 Tax=Heterorhabditis bacteriophora TaxID=37862 RepID=A0A1I7XF98_HETBA